MFTELSIMDLSKLNRRKLKKWILNRKKEQSKDKEVLIKQKHYLENKLKLEENKEKRRNCCELNQKRKIKDKDFENLMKVYEQVGYEIELKMALFEKEQKSRDGFFKRLDCFFLILSFLDGVEKVKFNMPNGEIRRFSLDDFYFIFLSLIVEEEKACLENEHKIMQLYMLINDNPIDTKHPFYLSLEQQNEMYAHILENRKKQEEVEKHSLKMHLDFLQTFLVDDFIEEDIHIVYSRIFQNKNWEIRKKRV